MGRSNEWRIEAIEKNKTWTLVDFPTDKNIIGVKWVYKTKLNEKGQVEKNKEKLVVRGFAQQPCINYDETFTPVTRLNMVILVLTIVAQNKWFIYQLDVKFTLLNGML